LLLSGVLAFSSLFLFTANWIWTAAYVQPLAVGCFLTLESKRRPEAVRVPVMVFVALALFGSFRAIGMSTWGAVCAADKNYFAARQIVREELDRAAPGSAVVLSSAFLYEAMRHPAIHALHEDWLQGVDNAPSDLNGDTAALLAIKPRAMILTQYDFYRRFQIPLAELKARPERVDIRTVNTAGIPSPDSFASIQRVLQHVSWAPVIVEFSWKQ